MTSEQPPQLQPLVYEQLPAEEWAEALGRVGVGCQATIIEGSLYITPHGEREIVDPNDVFLAAYGQGLVERPVSGGRHYESREELEAVEGERVFAGMYTTDSLEASRPRPRLLAGHEEIRAERGLAAIKAREYHTSKPQPSTPTPTPAAAPSPPQPQPQARRTAARPYRPPRPTMAEALEEERADRDFSLTPSYNPYFPHGYYAASQPSSRFSVGPRELQLAGLASQPGMVDLTLMPRTTPSPAYYEPDLFEPAEQLLPDPPRLANVFPDTPNPNIVNQVAVACQKCPFARGISDLSSQAVSVVTATLPSENCVNLAFVRNEGEQNEQRTDTVVVDLGRVFENAGFEREGNDEQLAGVFAFASLQACVDLRRGPQITRNFMGLVSARGCGAFTEKQGRLLVPRPGIKEVRPSTK